MKKKLMTAVAGFAAAGLLLSGCAGGGNSDSDNSADSDVNSYLPIGDEPTTTENSELNALLPESITKKGAIDIALDVPFPPMEFFDDNGRIVGFDAELGRLLGQKLGIKVNLNKQAFDSVIPSLQAGKNDLIMSGMNDTAERQKTLSFVEYIHAGFIILVNKNDDKGIKTIDDLCGKTVVLQKATAQGDLLREMNCGISLVELPTDVDAQTALRAGKGDAYIADGAVATYVAQTTADGNAFAVITDPENPSGYQPLYSGIGILKEETELIEAVQKAFQELIDEGAYTKVLERYGMDAYALESAEINLGG